ncbi:MAG: S49 family peptidase, partial [Bacteroidales bacterium]|nr:S49 family peptidase [Bacteroidales bacterium]
LLNKKLGITSDVVRTNAHSDSPSLTRPLNTYEKEALQENVERTYSTFTGIVAEGRGMRQEAVDSIGQGHVWSGADALEIGLVDQFGGLNDAIREAAALAGLEEYRTIEKPEAYDFYTKLMKQLMGDMTERAVIRELGDASGYYLRLKEIMSSGGIMAIMPYHLEIR